MNPVLKAWLCTLLIISVLIGLKLAGPHVPWSWLVKILLLFGCAGVVGRIMGEDTPSLRSRRRR